ncbi:primosomal replication protein N [Neisseria wadsworthii]|uniref:Primosomal replication protein n=1 Tax=Neisseria wadsworthii 9715 TaxID=1030841 RepID=G4CRI9_9NEIS|nr:primosomal replication protein N [Neisseria wadsworthii]EGZ45140.1 primosomal replication protein [Neisseria wadsworthii 9715]QMT35390.1 primosomal replication protein N [Neisseria wadsworthii]
MDNLFQITAELTQTEVLRYTPAGIPVLDVMLKHESWQVENGQKCLVKFELPAKIVGEQAKQWQYRENTMVKASGFLAQRNQQIFKPILRIQNIQEYKG